MTKKPNKQSLEKLIAIFCTKQNIATYLGVSKQRLNWWFQRGFPIDYAIKIEKATNLKVKKEDIASRII
jgi:DNA-binding transcriptional regulator YdaS (Cro superfamily)